MLRAKIVAKPEVVELLLENMKVIYILGAGGSGSTALSMLLGSHTKAVSVGELSLLDKYKALDLPCTCGDPISVCAFWKDIAGAREDFPVRPLMRPSNSLSQRRSGLSRDRHFARTVLTNLRIYERICEVSRKNIVIDASKDVTRFVYLFASGVVTLVPIYIVRDCRAYIYSRQARCGKAALSAILRWVRLNYETIRALKNLRCWEQTTKFSYSELTNRPQTLLPRVCAQAQIDYEPDMLSFHTKTFHTIGGTNKRFSIGPLTENKQWRQRLSFSNRILYYACGGQLINAAFMKNAQL